MGGRPTLGALKTERSTSRLLSIARSCPHRATDDAFPAEGIGTINGERGRGDEDRGTTPIVRALLKAVIESNMIKIAHLFYNK